MGIFTDHCYKAMWDYYNTPYDEVGDHFQGDRKNRAITNCIIYLFNVLNYGYTQTSKNEVVKKLKEMFPRQDGMELAKYLTTQNWKAHYWNPDVYEPRERTEDGKKEHRFSFVQAVRTGEYYGVPLSGLIVGYNKQVKTKKQRVWIPIVTPVGTVPWPTTVETSTEDPANLKVFQDLKNVKFGVGVNKGGWHCFLFSYGQVLEVHWEQEGSRLYGQKPLYGYEWNSGVILTPPDSTFVSRSIKDIAAKM